MGIPWINNSSEKKSAERKGLRFNCIFNEDNDDDL